MATITYRMGDDRRLFLQPSEEGGGTPDLTGATARLEVSTSSSCHIIDMIPVAGGFDLPLNVETTAGLSPRAYRAALVLTWPDGTRESETGLVLNIKGGC